MTTLNTGNSPAHTRDDETDISESDNNRLLNEIRAYFASLSKSELQDIARMRVQFSENATADFRQDFLMRQRIAQDLLDNDR